MLAKPVPGTAHIGCRTAIDVDTPAQGICLQVHPNTHGGSWIIKGHITLAYVTIPTSGAVGDPCLLVSTAWAQCHPLTFTLVSIGMAEESALISEMI